MKYKLTDKKLEVQGKTLYRIQYLRDIPRYRIKAGDLGGYLEGEHNLSQDGECVVRGNAQVFDTALVSGDAQVFGDVKMCGNAKVLDNAKVRGDVRVFGNAKVFGEARVYKNAWVYGSAEVCGKARVYGTAKVLGHATVAGKAQVYGRAKVSNNADVSGGAHVYGYARVCGSAWVGGHATAFEDAVVYGTAQVGGWTICTKPVYFCEFLHHTITVTDHHVGVGCEVHPFRYWIKNIEAIGKRNDYSRREIKMYKLIIFQLIEARTGKTLIKVI